MEEGEAEPQGCGEAAHSGMPPPSSKEYDDSSIWIPSLICSRMVRKSITWPITLQLGMITSIVTLAGQLLGPAEFVPKVILARHSWCGPGRSSQCSYNPDARLREMPSSTLARDVRCLAPCWGSLKCPQCSPPFKNNWVLLDIPWPLSQEKCQGDIWVWGCFSETAKRGRTRGIRRRRPGQRKKVKSQLASSIVDGWDAAYIYLLSLNVLKHFIFVKAE